MRLWLFALPLALVAAAAPASSTAPQEEEGGMVCLAIAHLWSGNNEDARRIRVVPVPDSFRRTFVGGGCGRFAVV
jgi:hypothetical protein